MWLPREEQQLLMAYQVCIKTLDLEGGTFDVKELSWFATYTGGIPFWRTRKIRKHISMLEEARREESERSSPPLGGDSPSSFKETEAWLASKPVVESANKMLQDRGLVEVREEGTGIYRVAMTVEGRDLARKYNSWWDRTGLWYNDKVRHHWITPVLSFGAGVLATLIMQWLSD